MTDRLDSRIRAFVVELVDDPPEAPPFPHSDVVVIRGDRSHRRRAMETTPTTTEPRTPWWRGPRVALAVTAAIVVVAVATFAIASLIDSDEPDALGAAGPVTIETEIDFSGSVPHGTFKVTVGADVLGCSSGTFVDMSRISGKTNKVMTCESGSNAGTFSILFDPPAGLDWSVLESSDDFAGLQGGGDFSWVLDQDSPSGEETLTGDIEYTS